ncbi:hypothetical protein [Niabella ginsengisoli]|uniref:Uncharacterized protein n=1 Tax=Niabella ginsengisoli TaxID=522298 RepID=A0ABS9SI26_9BACT|nr:hypothetical protein [Niabella ginsengisoli]MCH5598023.1 hypothetical protein [Niabella ginsengisoli]
MKEVVGGILHNPEMFCGARVNEVLISNHQYFDEKQQRFFVLSPILIKRTLESGKQKHYTFLMKNQMK